MALATSPPAVATRTFPAVRRRYGEALYPVALAAAGALPFIVLLAALVASRPSITLSGDQAVIALEVRDLLHGHQLVGAYSRYGWHHPGPAFLLPLAATTVLFGGAPWATDAGMLLGLAGGAAAFVVVGWKGGGRVGALAAAGVTGLYVHSVGPALLRSPWNPWAVLLPLAALVGLCGVMATGSLAAVAAGVLVTTVLVQTHVGVAPVSLALMVAGSGLWWAARGGVAPPRAEWTRPSVWLPGAATALLWLPPIVQEATAKDPNLTDLWRFFTSSHPGHSLPTAVAAVGRALGQLPFGTSSRFLATDPSVSWSSARGPALAIVVYVAIAAAVIAAARARQERFALGIGVGTLVAIVTAVFAVQSVDGALNGYIVAWVTVLPMACWVAVVILLFARPIAGGHGAPARLPVAVVVAAALAIVGTVTAASAAVSAPAASRESSPAVATAWARMWPTLSRLPRGAALLRLADPAAWPVQAGLALELEEHGWAAHVEPGWVFMFGASRRETGSERVIVTVAQTGVDLSTLPPAQTPGDLVGAAGQLAQELEQSVVGGGGVQPSGRTPRG